MDAKAAKDLTPQEAVKEAREENYSYPYWFHCREMKDRDAVRDSFRHCLAKLKKECVK